MATPASTRRTRKTSTRTRRRNLGLPRLGWWWLGIAFTGFVIAKTWPVLTAVAVALLAIGLITAARRPAWLQHAARRLPIINFYRPRLPARSHRSINTFQRMTPGHFEQAIAELALEDRDHVATATTVGGANDRGADVLVHLNDGRRILIQCKRYRNGNNVGSEDVQKTNGTYRDIHHCHAAIIVTTAGYTRAALDTNTMLPQPIRLIDGPQLEAWANDGPTPW